MITRRPKNEEVIGDLGHICRNRKIGILLVRQMWGPMARPKAHTPSTRRLRAVIEVLGFEGRGAQTRFAKEIGVDRRRLNNVLVGYPLSRMLAEKITRRYPSVATGFLLSGRSGGSLDRKLERHYWTIKSGRGFQSLTLSCCTEEPIAPQPSSASRFAAWQRRQKIA
jgi:hypothetical protein